MLTQCPNCQTTFRVTSEILRVADGQVRCGRCQTQFDALERLIDENDAGDVQSGRFLRPSRSTPPATQAEIEEPPAHEDITLETQAVEIAEDDSELEDADSETPQDKDAAEEWLEIEDPEQPGSTEGEIESGEALDADHAGEWRDEEEYGAEETTDDLGSGPLEESSLEVDLLAAQQRRAIAPAWKWLAAPLALLLLIQAVHHYRATLARHPSLGAPLVGLYGALGLNLQPDWNLHAYEIRQWGVVSDPSAPGTLRVRASITNLADFAQPYPLLKLVLEDRWGDQVRARAFEPADYLDPGAAPERLLAPAQKANATINIVDPGPDAEGFRFDVCLPGKRGVVCAEETPRR